MKQIKKKWKSWSGRDSNHGTRDRRKGSKFGGDSCQC